jgi:hypothetical protein
MVLPTDPLAPAGSPALRAHALPSQVTQITTSWLLCRRALASTDRDLYSQKN